MRTRVKSLAWCGIVELTFNRQPRCRTGNGCVHVNNLPMKVLQRISPFSATSVHLIFLLDYAALIDPFDVFFFVQFA